jgi:diadenylate cyclase
MNLLRISVEILLFATLIFLALRFVEGTRGEGLMKGSLVFFLACFVMLYGVSLSFRLPHVQFFLENVADIFFIAMVIIFQPELRSALIRLGRFSFSPRNVKGGVSEQIIKACAYLSKNRVGALMAIEGEVGLGNWVEKGILIDGIVSDELLCTIFWKSTKLHDGAVIINKFGQLMAASCFFPPSEADLDSSFGSRHRAALGVSEESDALVIVISEETGYIALANRGKLEGNLRLDELKERLELHFNQNLLRSSKEKNTLTLHSPENSKN